MTAITTAIYADGPLYFGGQAIIDDLKASGFSTVVAWALHVDDAGNLSFNDTRIVTGNDYVGDPAWPGLLADLKQGRTGVDRLLFSVGGWGVGDFPNIQTLLGNGGGQPGGALYQAFAALKQAIPTIDAIDFDDESLYDVATNVRFSQMLATLGYGVTFCPYSQPQVWTQSLSDLEQSNPGLVGAFNLQCYAGGSYNQPSDWIDAIQQAMGPTFPAAAMVVPGLWSRNGAGCASGQCPDSIEASFAGWKSTGIGGGFIWVLGDIATCEGSGVCGSGTAMGTAAYAQAVAAGLG